MVTSPFLAPSEVERLRAEVESLGLLGAEGFHDTASAGLAFAERQAVHEVLCAAFAPGIEGLLADYRPVMSAAMTKWPGSSGTKEIHRDFRLVDESRFRAVCIWVPLVDVDDDNGALRVLRGSHLVDSGPRTVPTTPRVPRDPTPLLDFDLLEAVPVPAGDAVVFDLAIAHGSSTNGTTQPRPAVGVACAPSAADLSLSFCHRDGTVELLEVVDPDVFRRIDWAVPPTELRSLGAVVGERPLLTTQELVRRSRAAVEALHG